ncbi:molybdenum cofactor guanylyltransferase [Fuchsiella alkaliacetigena]|uniref:molybdenum cofactor guanylyltransferase n=1 Tax=Fuchsiella alkaliacetigena TaxID=957042 RepID=UPI00200B966D|nr:molybdenum cofactor guanylyltransferase [Fuchsiella alkaliacetigena]MCK8824455.1 molybdenum cofactor guanylyltransferase [Fuchsiella alkaliacetigena]
MAGIILSGGKSSRMEGANKPLMKLGNKTMIQHLIDKLSILFKDVIVATKQPELYSDYDVQLAIDEFEHQGPLSGIHAALKVSEDQYNFIVACDMPLLNLDLVRYMLKQPVVDVLVPKIDGKLEPLHTIYSQSCVPKIEKAIAKGKFKIIDFWDQIDVKYIEEEKIRSIDPQLNSFFNVNNRQDYQQALDLLTENE